MISTMVKSFWTVQNITAHQIIQSHDFLGAVKTFGRLCAFTHQSTYSAEEFSWLGLLKVIVKISMIQMKLFYGQELCGNSHLGGDHETWGEGNGTPLQYSCLEHPMDGGAW